MIERYLAGRAAMVTGGASGQGRAIALALAEHGADVAIGSYLATHGPAAAEEDTYLPPRGDLDAVCHEIMARGAGAVGCDLDVRRTDSVEAFHAAAVNAFGKVDILINVAGVCAEQAVCGHSESLWLDIIDTNLNGYFRTTRACLPAMIERGWGRIVNIASTAASVGAKDNPAYCASKSGILGLTRCVALEGAPHGVTCVMISPTWVETELMRRNVAQVVAREGKGRSVEAAMDEFRKGNPQGRMMQPEEIAALFAFLASDDATYMTGHVFTCDGGETAGGLASR